MYNYTYSKEYIVIKRGVNRMKKGFLKKVFATTLVGIMAVSLMACGAKKEDSDLLATIKSNKKVIVGLSADYAPYEFHTMVDGKDETVGFDVDLAKEIAKDMGVELELKEMDFEALIGALKAGQIDMIISGMNPDDERRKEIDFSDIYYEAQHGVIVNAADKDKFKIAEDLNGKKIGAQLGSTQQKIAEEKVTGATLTLLANVNNLILELKSGKVEAIITEEPVAKIAIKNNPDMALSAIVFKDETGGNAVGLKKDSPELVAQINKTIKKLKDSGDLEKSIIKANELAAQNS